MINRFSINDVRLFWDRVAPIYEPTNKELGYVHSQRFEKALEFGSIRPNMSILNIWSRTGNLLPYLRKTPQLTIASREVSPEMMKIASRKYPDENFGITDLEDLSEFQGNMFDRIISLETLEHTPKPVKFLSELHRILKPDGKIIISLPPKGFEISYRLYKLLIGDHGEGPHNFLWPYQVKRIIKESGLTLMEHHPFIILPIGNDKMVRLSEKILTGIFKKTPVVNFGVRHFYVCKK